MKRNIISITLSVLMLSIFSACTISSTNTVKTDKQKEGKIIGPYLQNMSYDRVTVCWATPEGKVTVGKPDGKTKTVNNYEYHETLISGLNPGTRYTYDVLNDGTDRGKGTFITFPRKNDPFQFVVYGDTRSRHDVHQKVVNKIIKEDPLFIVNTGDLVANGNRMEDWETFFKITDKLIRNVPYFTVLGNHEKYSENYFNFFSLPGNESYYFYSVGDALFVILDMDGPDYSTPAYMKGEARERFWTEINRAYFEKEKKWLENVLTLNNDAGYIFVFFHPTWYSVKKSRVKEAEMRRKFWGDIFERYNVTAVMNGHDHYYHHARHGGVDYIVTAGGGAPLYKVDAIQPETVKAVSIEHYMQVNVNDKEAVMRAIDLKGNVIEEIKVKRRK